MITINLADRKLSHEYYVGVLEACSRMLEMRSCETGEQCPRLERLAERLGRAMKLSPADLRDLVCGASVHDIGKVGVPDSVLNKPAELSEDERRQIEQHVNLGVKTLRRLRVPEGVVQIAAQHHERIDGLGYPSCLQGSATALTARIFTVCDAYDAMVSDRCYRPGRPHREAVQELVRCMGTQFDKEVVHAFMTIDEAELIGLDRVEWQ